MFCSGCRLVVPFAWATLPSDLFSLHSIPAVVHLLRGAFLTSLSKINYLCLPLQSLFNFSVYLAFSSQHFSIPEHTYIYTVYIYIYIYIYIYTICTHTRICCIAACVCACWVCVCVCVCVPLPRLKCHLSEDRNWVCLTYCHIPICTVVGCFSYGTVLCSQDKWVDIDGRRLIIVPCVQCYEK